MTSTQDPSRTITKVAVAGATGSLGTAITTALRRSGKFELTLLVRNPPTDLPVGFKIAVVDYSDTHTLEVALAGQDAVVSALPRTLILSQLSLIDVAIAAGVQRFLPSEFGANLRNANARRLLNYQTKVQVEEYLEQKAAAGKISYTYIYTCGLVDWSIRAGIVLDFARRAVSLYNGGERVVSMNTLGTAARAVVGVLGQPAATENRAVCVHGLAVSQKQLLAYAKELTPPGESWSEEVVDLDQLEREASESKSLEGVKASAGANANMTLFHAGAMKAGFDPSYGNRFDGADNELLGVQQLGEEEIKALLRELYDECTQ